MGDGSVIGYDLNDRYCQISFYNEELQEPQTLETATENYQIPLILNYCEKRWYYGKDAKRLEARKKDILYQDYWENVCHRRRF